jgi:hypothetical protein
MTAATERAHWDVQWGVTKYDEDMTAYLRERLGRDPVKADFDAARITPYEISVVEKNLLTTAGVARMHGLITAVGALQAASSTAARIGVGDGTVTAGGGSVPAVVADTDLAAASGSTHRQFVIMDSGFPTAGTAMTFQATFTSALGNYAWNEFGIDIGTPTVANGTTVAALLLNHKTSIAQGTKTSGQSWAASAAITIS